VRLEPFGSMPRPWGRRIAMAHSISRCRSQRNWRRRRCRSALSSRRSLR